MMTLSGAKPAGRCRPPSTSPPRPAPPAPSVHRLPMPPRRSRGGLRTLRPLPRIGVRPPAGPGPSPVETGDLAMNVKLVAVAVTLAFSVVGVVGDYFLKLASAAANPLRSRWFYVGFCVYAS